MPSFVLLTGLVFGEKPQWRSPRSWCLEFQPNCEPHFKHNCQRFTKHMWPILDLQINCVGILSLHSGSPVSPGPAQRTRLHFHYAARIGECGSILRWSLTTSTGRLQVAGPTDNCIHTWQAIRATAQARTTHKADVGGGKYRQPCVTVRT